MSKSRPSAPLGASLVVLSSLFYASYAIWIKLMDDFFGAFTQATLRHIITAGLFVGIAVIWRQFEKVHWRRDARWFGLSFLSAIFVAGPLYYAVLHAGVGISLAISYIGIVLGMFFFGWLFAKERFTKDKLVSCVLGIIGLLLVFSPSVETTGWLALLSALVSGIATALNLTTSKKMPYNATQTAVIAWTLGIAANIPLMFMFSESLPPSDWHIEWLYLCLFAVASVIASWSAIRGVKLIEAGAAGILGLMEIVFGVLFGVLFFDERPGVLVLLGVGTIIAAATIPYLKDYNAKRGTLEE